MNKLLKLLFSTVLISKVKNFNEKDNKNKNCKDACWLNEISSAMDQYHKNVKRLIIQSILIPNITSASLASSGNVEESVRTNFSYRFLPRRRGRFSSKARMRLSYSSRFSIFSHVLKKNTIDAEKKKIIRK